MKFLCRALETLCSLTHPFVRLEVLLTGKHCNLAELSYKMDEKYNLGVWHEPRES